MPPDAPSQTEGTLTSIRLTDVGPAKEFYLDLGERLTLIAGDNGLGKSFLLDAAWWALTGTWASHPAYPFASRHTARPRIEYRIKNITGQELVGESRFDWKSHSWQDLDNRPSVAAVSIFTRVDGSFAIADETRRSATSWRAEVSESVYRKGSVGRKSRRDRRSYSRLGKLATIK